MKGLNLYGVSKVQTPQAIFPLLLNGTKPATKVYEKKCDFLRCVIPLDEDEGINNITLPQQVSPGTDTTILIGVDDGFIKAPLFSKSGMIFTSFVVKATRGRFPTITAESGEAMPYNVSVGYNLHFSLKYEDLPSKSNYLLIVMSIVAMVAALGVLVVFAKNNCLQKPIHSIWKTSIHQFNIYFLTFCGLMILIIIVLFALLGENHAPFQNFIIVGLIITTILRMLVSRIFRERIEDSDTISLVLMIYMALYLPTEIVNFVTSFIWGNTRGVSFISFLWSSFKLLMTSFLTIRAITSLGFALSPKFSLTKGDVNMQASLFNIYEIAVILASSFYFLYSPISELELHYMHIETANVYAAILPLFGYLSCMTTVSCFRTIRTLSREGNFQEGHELCAMVGSIIPTLVAVVVYFRKCSVNLVSLCYAAAYAVTVLFVVFFTGSAMSYCPVFLIVLLKSRQHSKLGGDC